MRNVNPSLKTINKRRVPTLKAQLVAILLHDVFNIYFL